MAASQAIVTLVKAHRFQSTPPTAPPAAAASAMDLAAACAQLPMDAAFSMLRSAGFPRLASPRDRALLGVVATLSAMRQVSQQPRAEVTGFCRTLVRGALGGYWPEDFPLGGTGEGSAAAIMESPAWTARAGGLPARLCATLRNSQALDTPHVERACAALVARRHEWTSNAIQASSAFVLLSVAMQPTPRPDLVESILGPALQTSATATWLTAMDIALTLRKTIPATGESQHDIPDSQALLTTLEPHHIPAILDGASTLLASGRSLLLPGFGTSNINETSELRIALDLLEALAQTVPGWTAPTWERVEGRLAASARRMGREIRTILDGPGAGGFHVSQYRSLLAASDRLAALAIGHASRHAILDGGQPAARHRARA